jgi:hypothetical protein
MKKLFAVCVMLINLLVSAQEVGMENRKYDEVVVKNRNQVEFEKALTDLVDGSDSDLREGMSSLTFYLNRDANPNVQGADGRLPLESVIDAGGNTINHEHALKLGELLIVHGAFVTPIQMVEEERSFFEKNLLKLEKGSVGRPGVTFMFKCNFSPWKCLKMTEDNTSFDMVYHGDKNKIKLLEMLWKRAADERDNIIEQLEGEVKSKDAANLIMKFVSENTYLRSQLTLNNKPDVKK